ncbi:MAG: hypothetical protein Q8O87_02575 [bacterium]|nr:hypothetical protein [bacterium]
MDKLESQPKEEQGGASDVEILEQDFIKLDDKDVARSPLTRELFESGPSGEEEVMRRIDAIQRPNEKDDALFRAATWFYYDFKHDIESALGAAEQILN